MSYFFDPRHADLLKQNELKDIKMIVINNEI